MGCEATVCLVSIPQDECHRLPSRHCWGAVALEGGIQLAMLMALGRAAACCWAVTTKGVREDHRGLAGVQQHPEDVPQLTGNSSFSFFRRNLAVVLSFTFPPSCPGVAAGPPCSLQRDLPWGQRSKGGDGEGYLGRGKSPSLAGGCF